MALRPFSSWEELIEDPVPPREYIDSLLALGVGTVVAPKGTEGKLVDVVEREFVLDPLLPPEEVPERGAVVARSVDADSAYGYKRKYGKWPVEHLGEKGRENMILNPFWIATWEIKYVDKVAFMPEMAALGVSSPVPPELLEATYVPLTGLWGPDALAEIETLLARSHYWRRGLRAKHRDCYDFAGKEPRGFWVGHKEPEIVIADALFTREDLVEIKQLNKNSPLL
ncbi:MAG: hypothetical protein GXO07_02665 [Crenarchaeota archaeon]|nr:hypothetical protein [Thermoproteota archaeon]